MSTEHAMYWSAQSSSASLWQHTAHLSLHCSFSQDSSADSLHRQLSARLSKLLGSHSMPWSG